jgi:hypothetical protein
MIEELCVRTGTNQINGAERVTVKQPTLLGIDLTVPAPYIKLVNMLSMLSTICGGTP